MNTKACKAKSEAHELVADGWINPETHVDGFDNTP